MSYNIDTIDILSGSLKCSHRKARQFAQTIDYVPEMFGDYLDSAAHYKNTDGTLRTVPWTGSCSGWAEPDLPRFLVECCTGNAELQLVWEGGDSITYMIVEDGAVYIASETVVLSKGERRYRKAEGGAA